jgi:hypothetical protein
LGNHDEKKEIEVTVTQEGVAPQSIEKTKTVQYMTQADGNVKVITTTTESINGQETSSTSTEVRQLTEAEKAQMNAAPATN